jgi:hypothetical protein
VPPTLLPAACSPCYHTQQPKTSPTPSFSYYCTKSTTNPFLFKASSPTITPITLHRASHPVGCHLPTTKNLTNTLFSHDYTHSTTNPFFFKANYPTITPVISANHSPITHHDSKLLFLFIPRTLEFF